LLRTELPDPPRHPPYKYTYISHTYPHIHIHIRFSNRTTSSRFENYCRKTATAGTHNKHPEILHPPFITSPTTKWQGSLLTQARTHTYTLTYAHTPSHTHAYMHSPTRTFVHS